MNAYQCARSKNDRFITRRAVLNHRRTIRGGQATQPEFRAACLHWQEMDIGAGAERHDSEGVRRVCHGVRSRRRCGSGGGQGRQGRGHESQELHDVRLEEDGGRLIKCSSE